MTRYEDPLTLFRDAVDALKAGDYARVVTLCDPVSLRMFKREMLVRFAPRDTPPYLPTADDLMRQNPGFLRDVAEHYAQQMAQRPPFADEIHFTLRGVTSYEALEAMDPEAVFAARLAATSPSAMLEQFQFLDADVGVLPEHATDDAFADFTRWIALGVVPDGERICHVLYRHYTSVNPRDLTHDATDDLSPEERELDADLRRTTFMLAVQQCRRQDDGMWRLVAMDNFLQPSGLAFGFDDDQMPDPQ